MKVVRAPPAMVLIRDQEHGRHCSDRRKSHRAGGSFARLLACPFAATPLSKSANVEVGILEPLIIIGPYESSKGSPLWCLLGTSPAPNMDDTAVTVGKATGQAALSLVSSLVSATAPRFAPHFIFFTPTLVPPPEPRPNPNQQ